MKPSQFYFKNIPRLQPLHTTSVATSLAEAFNVACKESSSLFLIPSLLPVFPLHSSQRGLFKRDMSSSPLCSKLPNSSLPSESPSAPSCPWALSQAWFCFWPCHLALPHALSAACLCPLLFCEHTRHTAVFVSHLVLLFSSGTLFPHVASHSALHLFNVSPQRLLPQ